MLGVYLALTATIYALFQRRVSSVDLAVGVSLFWLVLTIASTLFLPGASYLFLWPLLAGLIVLGLVLTATQMLNIIQRFLVLIPVTIGLILFGTAIYLIQRMFGVGIYPIGGAMSVLLMGLVFPYLDFHSLPRASDWVVGTLLAGMLLLIWVGLTTEYNTDRPHQNFLFYSMNVDTREASWVADAKLPEDNTLSPWLGSAPVDGIMKDVFPGSLEEQVWINDAPALIQPGPEMTVLEDRTEAGVRYLRLNLRSPRGAWGVMADITAKGAILEGELYGEHYNREIPQDNLFFKVIDMPAEGVGIGLKLLPGIPVTIRLADVSLDLPCFGNLPGLNTLPLRTGFGGGHGVDGMTLLHRYFKLYE